MTLTLTLYSTLTSYLQYIIKECYISIIVDLYMSDIDHETMTLTQVDDLDPDLVFNLDLPADAAAKEKDAPPEFRVQMHDMSIRVGEPATFDCQVTGHPRPEVFWAKNGIRMKESARWKFIVEEDHYTLLIYEVILKP